ncbi:hypothetical protein [Streptomyces sp. MA5143a]|uniref:hypothetical protein n=1 Tax=Streptomyces sp. MA5143a TaxID=2083010 RepID=UPI000D1A962D|nr:hypothetical protein [Streptomyces sp. MA5143a]SPF06643.1 hypothetical protein SMA5143A_7480 [Streptomyces sp. MA5143a]
MAATPAQTIDLKAQYSAQVAADLERNAKEQDRLRAEIDALNDQLLRLQQDHTVLVNMQQALGVVTPEPAPAAEQAAAPSVPRQKATTPSAGKQPRTRKTTAPQGVKQTKAKKPAAKAAAAKGTQPTLVELIRQHLTEQSEPRSAAEVAAALGQTHPDRRIQTNVVRTTLEGLVAKSKAQRTKQGSSVYYTALETQEPTTSPQTDSQPAQANS